MLNKEKHQLIMGQILKDIYADVSIAPLVGFKGGTCAYFFYDLPRFSVDLDFDLFSTNERIHQQIFEKINRILEHYGTIKDSYLKRYTIFFLLSYGDEDHNIKVEINIRMLLPDLKNHYEIKEYLGISMLVGKKDYLFAGKLAALTLRSDTAMRDIYDSWYFAKHRWDINADVILAHTGKTIKAYLPECIALIEKTTDNRILQGIGELLGDKDKVWVKQHLRSEAVFLLKNYWSVLK